MNEKVILDAISKIEPQVFWALLKLFGVGIIVLVLKGFIENIAAYVQFRLDKRLGLGVKVQVRGVEGKIVDYDFSWINIKTKDGMEIVAIKRWRMEKWMLVNGE